MPTVEIPGVGDVEFPDSMSGEQINAAAARLHAEAMQTAAPAPTPKSGGLMATIGERLAATQGLGPMIGATVGSLAGGTPGAAFGGAAGTGFQQLYDHAKELPGALADVGRNLLSEPGATLVGFGEGAASGAIDAGLSAGVNAGMNYAADKVMSGIAKTGKAIYRGYLKPSLRASKVATAAEVVDTAIKEGIPVTRGGLKRANVLTAQLKAEVDDALSASDGVVDLHSIANRVRAFAKRTYYRAGVPTPDFDAAMRVADTIDAHPSLMKAGPMVEKQVQSAIVDASGQPILSTVRVPGPQVADAIVSPSKANVVKQAIGEAVGDNQFGMPGSKAAKRTGKYAYAKTRQAIEAVVPEVAAPNARNSRLIDLASALRGAVEREANQYALHGTKSIVSGMVGSEEYARTKNPYRAAAIALGTRLALTPAVMTRFAIVAARLGERVPGIAPLSAARLAAQAFGYSEAQQQPEGVPQDASQ